MKEQLKSNFRISYDSLAKTCNWLKEENVHLQKLINIKEDTLEIAKKGLSIIDESYVDTLLDGYSEAGTIINIAKRKIAINEKIISAVEEIEKLINE